MSALTCGEPLSLSHLPSDRILRLAGLTEAQLAVSLDPLPRGAPVVVRYRVVPSSRRSLDVVDDVLERLESVAMDLFPAWLPSATAIAASSDFERRVDRGWAVGRIWNQVYASHSLVPPIRVDLMWPDERCVVEIDGPDHRGVLKYSDDRRRDNGLVLDGFAVLRFTNGEISDDPQRVLAVIERLLINKRRDEGNPA
ncbi:MAG TPA: DUF559 domain-containing protein [Mycobacterium sp.]|nr:DUF559 domain-containing protein [Mycobacterium sp.]